VYVSVLQVVVVHAKYVKLIGQVSKVKMMACQMITLLDYTSILKIINFKRK